MLLFSSQDKIKNTKSTRTGPAIKIRNSTTSNALSSVLQEPKGKKTESEYYKKVQTKCEHNRQVDVVGAKMLQLAGTSLTLA